MAPRLAANHQATTEQGAKHLGRSSGAPSARAPRPPPAAPEWPTGRRAEQSFNSVPDRVFLIQVAASKTKIYMVLELVNGGELLDRIAASEGKLPEQEARRLFQQLVDGVSYCHEKGVCHRDLKLENILVDRKGNIKISDFGLSALPQHLGAGHLPFDDRNIVVLYQKIFQGDAQIPEWLSPGARNLLRSILEPDPASRQRPL
ncbi:CBL-interacting protein kinase 1 [Zea mays]|uniref:CBL-interacting protein kinase 1 n=1 Tax=Zea mays TaxID=4577 RepID=A0A317YEX9_MAIZE|nr:CBL-interacting protein kinase 1 [Zea mays]